MKQTIIKYNWVFILFLLMNLSSCEVDTLEEVEGLEQVVSLVQLTDGSVSLKADNLIIDKTNQMFRKAFGLTLSGFQQNEGFSADITLDYNDIPEGSVQLSPEECFLTLTQNSTEKINRLTVPGGQQQSAFYLNITKAALEAHEGKVIGVKIKVKNLSNYSLNPLDSAYITMNTADFASKKIDKTIAYLLNPTFKRKDGTTTRFAPLQDWKSNDAINNSRTEGAGYDENCGYMGIERWGSWDKAIINGKIYQTFTIPKGRYLVEVDMKKVAPERDTYLLAALGNNLPDAANVSTALGIHEITSSDNNKTVSIEFSVDDSKEISTGFLINIENQVERILQASAIRMYYLESFFD